MIPIDGNLLQVRYSHLKFNSCLISTNDLFKSGIVLSFKDITSLNRLINFYVILKYNHPTFGKKFKEELCDYDVVFLYKENTHIINIEAAKGRDGMLNISSVNFNTNPYPYIDSSGIFQSSTITTIYKFIAHELRSLCIVKNGFLVKLLETEYISDTEHYIRPNFYI